MPKVNSTKPLRKKKNSPSSKSSSSNTSLQNKEIDLLRIPIIDFHKVEESYVPSTEEKEHGYNPFSIDHIQYYNPIYSALFGDSKIQELVDIHPDFANMKSIPIGLTHQQYFVDLNHVYDVKTKQTISVPIHIKYSPLLDNCRYLSGVYDIQNIERYYPAKYPIDNTLLDNKITQYHNMSYVDNLFCYMTNVLYEKHGFIHGIQYYGSCCGVQKVFKLNVYDDLDYLNDTSFFIKNINTLFTVAKPEYIKTNDKQKKKKININEDFQGDLLVEYIDLDSDSNEKHTTVSVSTNTDKDGIEMVFENTHIEGGDDDESKSEDSDSDSEDSELNYSSNEEEEKDENDADSEDDDDTENDTDEDADAEDDNDENDIDDEEEEEEEVNIYMKNIPIHMIFSEKLENTLYHRISHEEPELEKDEFVSICMQILMILITYQKVFYFTHNDLHSNNIMYISTEEPYLYYKYNSTIYKVPTYGKIYKIIDFGRSIYTYRGKLFCSDSFFKKGDADTQYNFGPFYDPNKPKIEPNYSFDLCRLAASLFDDFIPEDVDMKELDLCQRLVYRWSQDDNNKNVLYKKNGDERYPDFKLYKMIARTVHKHVPKKQLDLNIFKSLACKIPLQQLHHKQYFMDIDKLPCYAATEES
jgi:hypothetical protein